MADEPAVSANRTPAKCWWPVVAAAGWVVGFCVALVAGSLAGVLASVPFSVAAAWISVYGR